MEGKLCFLTVKATFSINLWNEELLFTCRLSSSLLLSFFIHFVLQPSLSDPVNHLKKQLILPVGNFKMYPLFNLVIDQSPSDDHVYGYVI